MFNNEREYVGASMVTIFYKIGGMVFGLYLGSNSSQLLDKSIMSLTVSTNIYFHSILKYNSQQN